MPIGDPHGGEFYDLGRGLLTRVWMATVPVRDLDDAVEYYRDVLGLDIVLDARQNNWVEMGAKEPLAKIVLFVPRPDDPRQPGTDTGIVFATDSIFEVHRRLVDEGVKFLLKPERQPWGGLVAIFSDPDGNRFTVLDDVEHYSRTDASAPVERKEKSSGVTIRTIITK
jgi:predicted enzyme related to lactoylglutathione lyase